MNPCSAIRSESYVPEIDGLRAIAVLGVLFFHLGMDQFTGGFVGVDVFFVISGFLITRIIIHQQISGFFTFRNFYLRRARRILPALLFLLFLNWLLSFLLFTPELFKESSESTIASIFFSSNILFYLQSGYFDTDAYLKPLLHTWSLGVEEQFYLFWPLLVYYLFQKASNTVLFIIFASCIVVSQYMATHNAELSFFIIVFRAHEFFIGAALCRIKQPNPDKVWLLELIALSGLLLMISAMMLFNESDTTFPGINALIPCLGAAMCIYASSAKFTSHILNNPPMVKIGLISYSLYLIHWPLIVYYQYVFNVTNLNHYEMLTLSLLSVILAVFMYRFVEQPFRIRQQSKTSNVKFINGMSILILLLIGLTTTVIVQNGWSWRFNNKLKAEIDSHQAQYDLRQTAIRAPLCHHNDEQQSWADFQNQFDQCNQILPNSVLVFGDSHAADLWLGLHKNLPDRNIIQITGAACRYTNKLERCAALFSFVQDLVLTHRNQIVSVVYTQRGKFLDSQAISQTATYLDGLKHNDNHVYWFGPQMEYRPGITTQLSREDNLYDFASNSDQWQKNELFELDQQIESALSETVVTFISKLSSFCPNRSCPILTPENAIIYVERHHLTISGTTYLNQILLKKLSDKL